MGRCEEGWGFYFTFYSHCPQKQLVLWCSHQTLKFNPCPALPVQSHLSWYWLEIVITANYIDLEEDF